MDMNDRQLRFIVDGLGGKVNGTPREDGFDITVASEVMAVFCLATDLEDLKARLSRIVCAYTYDGQPVTAGQIGAAGAMTALLKDALRRARKHPGLKDIASRMKLVEGDSVSCMEKLMDPVDVIYLDPMFPKRQKSGLINKKLQLIQKLEPPCSEEKDLFDAAIKAGPSRIIVKRPLKSVCLDGREPSYILKGKAIRYDCYVM